MPGTYSPLGEASYLRRLGALCATLCGGCIVVSLPLVVLAPATDVVPALLMGAVMFGAGVLLARRP